MLKIILISTLILLISTHPTPKRFPSFSNLKSQYTSQQAQPYQVEYFTQKVSHFDFSQTGKTWKMKYLIDSSSFTKTGPIIMYCGNQGPIEMFYKNAGWYNKQVKEELKGLLVYPQHRYFGVSWPFGNKEQSMKKQNLAYLNTEEAMMDFVEFIQYIKKEKCPSCPVMVFGGSYGGMLAAWMRMKYPNVVDMAHAASAPIYYYKNRQNFDIGVFFQIVTSNFARHNANCPNVIRESFKRLQKYQQSGGVSLTDLSQWFNLCKPLKTQSDISFLIDYINNGYSYMAMLNYPYPTSFLKSLPAWPANSSCIPLDTASTSSPDSQLFPKLKASIQYYYSYNKTQCNEIFQDNTSDDDMGGWNVLACGDQAMPMSTDGVKDMFYKEEFDYDAYSQQCFNDWGRRPDYQFTLNHFGGVTDKEYMAASNIVFTNGGLDPWSGASPVQNLSASLPSCFIPNGAHHLDLRPPNAADPADVIQCRSFVLNTLKSWISKRQEQNTQTSTFNFDKKIVPNIRTNTAQQ